jgi:Putative metallopeptidase
MIQPQALSFVRSSRTLRACLALVAVGLLACADDQVAAGNAIPPAATADQPSGFAAAIAERRSTGPRRHLTRTAPATPNRGRLRFSYGRTTTPEYQNIQQTFRDEKFFEENVIADLNRSFVLPRDIDVHLQECAGEVNAFYDSTDGAIHLCYEMFEHFLQLFTALVEPQTDAQFEEVGGKSVAALIFVFYHELGHALVDVYDLPVTGKEEDAVDQLAALILLETWEGEDSELALTASAEWFGSSSADPDLELDMADEHSLDEQRFYNLVCWTYGSDPEYFASMVEDWGLPEDRAERCPGEYAQMSRSWDTLLGPHMRETE